MKSSSIEKTDKSNKKDLFLIQNKLLFKKYHPIKSIGKGTFSTVYLTLNILSNNYVAIKAEKRNKNEVELLESEAFLLYYLRGFGIPEVLSYGRTKSHNILVMPLLGRSLLEILILKNKYINYNDICSVSIQILDRIEWVHSNNIVYRDIKPENFLFGEKDKETLYLIDFGLCRKYKSSKTGKHIPPKSLGKFTGTSRYASVYAMAGNEQSRRDDIESIGYMIIYFMKKKLPWQGIKGNSYKECYHKLYLMKKNIKLQDLCKGLPSEVIDYMNYAKYLKFEQEPDYNYLKNLFKRILKRNGVSLDNYILSWCRVENLNLNSDSKDMSYKKNSNGTIKRKSSPQNRLYKKIQESIENKNKSLTNIILKSAEISEKNRISSINYYENSVKNKNELTSEISNTMKAIVNKNINTINSGFNQTTRINLNRINSEKNIYDNNFISFLNNNNNNLKTNFSLDNKMNNYLSFKQQNFDKKNDGEINKSKGNNYELKRINLPKSGNKNRKIISISPISHDAMNKLNTSNSIMTIKNNNNRSNNYNKINQIKLINMKMNININKEKGKEKYKENNYINQKENIIYNTYNTFNTYNSYNMPKNETINNNINIHNIYQKEPSEIHNYQNYKRIKKNEFDNNYNNNNIIHIPNYMKSGGNFIEKNAKSYNNIIPNNKMGEKIKYGSIEIKPDSITKNFSYKNIKSQMITKKNNSLNKIDNHNYVTQILGHNNNSNKINYLNRNNTYIHNINSNNISDAKKQNNYSSYNIKRENINNLSTPKFVNKTENSDINENNIKIYNISKKNLRNELYFNSNNYKDKINEYNSYKKGLNNNYSYANTTNKNIYDFNNDNNNSSSIQNKPSTNNKLFHKTQINSYIYKNKKGSNSIITHSTRNNMDKLNNLNISNNNSYRNIPPKQSLNNSNQNIQNGLKDKDKNIKPLFIKMKPKILNNHSLKIINNSSSNKKKEYSGNGLIKNNYNDKENNYYINKYRTEEVDIQYGENNNSGNKLNRINRYKIVRNRVVQNNNNNNNNNKH